MSQKDYWEQVYSARPTEKLGWFEPHLRTSLTWIRELRLGIDAPIIDVGGGASTLADDLLEAGYHSITVLDISEKALLSVKSRLGKRAESVTWLNGDITAIRLPSQYYELWHDRAVFHFLTAPKQQQRYRENLLRGLKPGGHLIIGTFAPEAPPTCSGLPVQRYSKLELETVLGEEFDLERNHEELHTTPEGIEQVYLYCQFRKAMQSQL